MTFCNDFTCKHNDGTGCAATEIHIEIEYGSMEQGKHHVYNVCQQYEEKRKTENRTAYSQWDETEYAIKHKTRYEREREAYEEAEREDRK